MNRLSVVLAGVAAFFGTLVFLTVAPPTSAALAAPEGADAVQTWLGNDAELPAPGAEQEPGQTRELDEVAIEADHAAGSRVADVIFGLAFIGILYLLGWGIQKLALEQVKPWIFASVCLGILMFTAVNPIWWQFAGLKMDESGVEVTRNAASDTQVTWDDLTEVRVEDGKAFPVFTDDTMLVLVAGDDEVRIPRYVPNAEAVAAYVLAHLPNSAPE